MRFLLRSIVFAALCAHALSVDECDRGACIAELPVEVDVFNRADASVLLQKSARVLPQGASRSAQRFSGGGSEQASAEVAPCKCELANSAWVKPKRGSSEARCVFIDLGAADGNTYQEFLQGKFVELDSCPGGTHEAWLVEANPRFSPSLTAIEDWTNGTGTVHALDATAAYCCEGSTEFYIDVKSWKQNDFGSSMSSDHQAVANGKRKVVVPTVNVIQLLYEQTIPEDKVILKMDIEGAEWDIVPSLSQSSAASLIDDFFLELHGPNCSLTETSTAELEDAMTTLAEKGVNTPKYFTPTLLLQQGAALGTRDCGKIPPGSWDSESQAKTR